MPYINTITNVAIPENTEKELAAELGKAITLIRGKTENWLMLNFTENSRMYCAGSDAPPAMVEIQIFGSASSDEYDALTSAICDLISGKLGINANRIYVKYGEFNRWGWNNMNF
ncbi:MAG: hypothetical protein IJY04_03575 [Clostridia bacterium]|nr:hypothetical protein [Clostridia bacterium]